MPEQHRWHAAERLSERYAVDHAGHVAIRLREQLQQGVDCWRIYPSDPAEVWDLHRYFVLFNHQFCVALFNPAPPGTLVTVLNLTALTAANLPKLRAALGKRGRRAVAQDANLKRRHRVAWDDLTE